MNCISWIVGHLAWHEQRTFLQRPQNVILFPQLNEVFAFGAPMSTPSFNEMLDIWRTVTSKADPYLDSLTTEILLTYTLAETQNPPHGQPPPPRSLALSLSKRTSIRSSASPPAPLFLGGVTESVDDHPPPH